MVDRNPLPPGTGLFRHAAFLACLVVSALLFGKVTGCSTSPKTKNEVAPAAIDCGDLPLGQAHDSVCEDGSRKIEVCTSAGLQVARACDSEKPPVDCDDGDAVTFADVKPTLTESCVGCHQGYDTFAVAKGKIDAFIARTSLADDDPRRMPKPPAAALPPLEKGLFKAWKEAGLKEKAECLTGGPVPTPPSGFVSLDWIETMILNDLTKLDPDDREDYRYLVSAHRLNAGADPSEMAAFEHAANKAVHSISLERDAYPIQKVAEGVYRVDAEELGIDAANWLKIEAADKLQVESFTSKGQIIKGLVGGGVHLPWVHVDNFADVVMGDATLYYDLLEIPGTFDQLAALQGVDFAGDLANFDARLVGLPDSPLAPHNRLMSRHDSDEGYFWTTFDTGALDVAEKNLFEFPLLADTGTATPFVFVASEVIYTLPNGLQGYALFNAAGIRQDKAPVDVVRDFSSPVSAEIQNSISCHRCHNSGILPREDAIRAHVTANAAQFQRADVDRVQQLYRPAGEVAAMFAGDNAEFGAALARIDVKPSDPDPINVTNDRFQLGWDVKKTAAFVFLSEADFKECVNGSAVGRVQAGQLLTGGSITYDQFIAVLPALKVDCRLFQDPL